MVFNYGIYRFKLGIMNWKFYQGRQFACNLQLLMLATWHDFLSLKSAYKVKNTGKKKICETKFDFRDNLV